MQHNPPPPLFRGKMRLSFSIPPTHRCQARRENPAAIGQVVTISYAFLLVFMPPIGLRGGGTGDPFAGCLAGTWALAWVVVPDCHAALRV